ncbi:MAG: LON peptidase substrate-binding domain-containing protein [Planctomycetaceae bacterium]|nr:LON peptidase substrate-binding domain-containing protein [Planctomycetaceae bacterium]
MSAPFDADVCLKQFTGYAPMFPLPNGVLFPHLVLPLHIFEDRYREMTADTLAGDRMLALAMLRPGHESEYSAKSAPIYPTVCLGQIVVDEELDDGRYNIIVRGICRARVIDELDTDDAYRVAHLEPLKDVYPAESTDCWADCRAKLIDAFRRRFPQLDSNVDLQRAVRDELSLGVLCDLLSSSLVLSPADSAEALMETDVRRRCRWLLNRLQPTQESYEGDSGFPPAFSVN